MEGVLLFQFVMPYHETARSISLFIEDLKLGSFLNLSPPQHCFSQNFLALNLLFEHLHFQFGILLFVSGVVLNIKLAPLHYFIKRLGLAYIKRLAVVGQRLAHL
jgi:hypothetical protein